MFSGLLRMCARCPECGVPFEREAGYFLGSTYINYGITAGVTTLSYVVLHFGFNLPNEWVMPGLMAFCLIFPVFFFRYARSLWLAIDCFFDRMGAEQTLAQAQQPQSKAEDEN